MPALRRLMLPAVTVSIALIATALVGPSAPALMAEAGADRHAATELPVWVAPQAPHPENPTNPLAGRLWGVYHGPQDQLYAPYESADPQTQAELDTIRVRPRTKWYGGWVSDDTIASTAAKYIATSQAGNPETLSQIAVFRMRPWENDACTRPPTAQEQRSYKTWIKNLATSIGAAPMLVVMQPDGPFLYCVPNMKLTSKLLRFATRTLSGLPNTSVYIDAGAADWCKANTKPTAARCAGILTRTGVRYARGFALDSTHYTGPEENILLGAQMVELLKRRGFGTKHFIIDTAKSGQPTEWSDMIAANKGEERDNARTCTRPGMTRCVTLGIPPTARPADPEWGLSSQTRQLAAEHVDGFVWFGRPWLYYQADPFVMERALDMVRSTPWPELNDEGPNPLS